MSLTAPQMGVALFALLMIGVVWLFTAHQLSDSRERALARQGAAMANLSFIVAENLEQVLDRAKTLRMLVHDIQQREQARENAEMASLILSDPVFNRLSLYDGRGRLRYNTSPSTLLHLESEWQHSPAKGADDLWVLPRSAWQHPWSMPLLLPEVPEADGGNRFMLLELDLGYLLRLYQNLDLGAQASIHILTAAGEELAQVDQSGLVIESGRFDNSVVLDSRLHHGRFNARDFNTGKSFLSFFHRLESFAFVVVVRQAENEILAPHLEQRSRYVLTVLLLSLVVLVGVVWLLWMMHGREVQLRALEYSEQRNHALLERLQREHRQTLEAASRDALTGLYNRRLFLELAHSHLLGAKRQGRFAAVFFIDLDRFKAINDTLGHKVGDQLLQAVSERLTSSLRESDIIGRFGGDEFVVMLTGVKRREDIELKARELVTILAAPYIELQGSGLGTSPSIGIALSPQDGMEIETLVKHADMAMYTAKRAGRGRYAFFDNALNSHELDTSGLAQQLPSGMAEQLCIHLQPRMSLPDYRVTGFEALVRWNHPEFGLLPPSQLLPLAESLGLMPALARQVLQQACEQLLQWRADGVPIVPVAVNLGLSQLQAAELGERIEIILQRYDIDPAWLELEINERDLQQLASEQLDLLHQLQQHGLGLTIDDFGSSGLDPEQIRRLPFSRIKLDRAFIRDIRNSYDDNVLLSATISVAQRLGLKVAAKGVETPDQLVYLKLSGCDEVQGHLFSRAMNAEELNQYRQQTEQELAV
ncbi:hypothetical protein GCM10009104_31820 [Marinobacterium maritimum]|uniref:Diguanylate cyclase (GGDEF) domain-containing protein n=1 Tax=Marinobacterium maritimum TaxID=500162 RepID=A0ABN1IAP5_9GAMM